MVELEKDCISAKKKSPCSACAGYILFNKRGVIMKELLLVE